MNLKLLRIFANPVRIKLLNCLASNPKNVSQLIQNCGLSQSAVSQHLRLLRDFRFVNTNREGRKIYYSLKFPEIVNAGNQLISLLKEAK